MIMAEFEVNVGSEPDFKYIITYSSHSSTDLESSPSYGEKTTASLLRLPPKMRNIVYTYALDGNVWSIKLGGGRAKIYADTPVKYELSLLRVNR